MLKVNENSKKIINIIQTQYATKVKDLEDTIKKYDIELTNLKNELQENNRQITVTDFSNENDKNREQIMNYEKNETNMLKTVTTCDEKSKITSLQNEISSNKNMYDKEINKLNLELMEKKKIIEKINNIIIKNNAYF